jgi:prolyl-tRNA synthetase
MYQTFADWVQSYRDLPLLINQWCNVVRWEKRTYPFLRTSEFLWQEGHTVHKTADEAESMAQQALGWYKQFYEEVFAISPYVGVKSSSERFAGANQTYTIELVMADGKALQAATSHNLGDNFSKVFGIEYLDEANTKQHPFQTSWGLSTRAIGGLILVHGDDAGLVLPPKAAPIQVVVLAIQDKEETKRAAINSYAAGLAESLKAAGVLVELDTDNNQSFGSRINKWELKGVPVRLEIGGKEAESQQVTVVRRDTFTKETISSADIAHSVTTLLATMQADMLAKSLASKEALTKEAKNFDEFTSYLGDQKHFIRAFWCERPECEKEIKEATRATTRCLELEHVATHETAVCVRCDQPATRKWLFAQSY